MNPALPTYCSSTFYPSSASFRRRIKFRWHSHPNPRDDTVALCTGFFTGKDSRSLTGPQYTVRFREIVEGWFISQTGYQQRKKTTSNSWQLTDTILMSDAMRKLAAVDTIRVGDLASHRCLWCFRVPGCRCIPMSWSTREALSSKSTKSQGTSGNEKST